MFLPPSSKKDKSPGDHVRQATWHRSQLKRATDTLVRLKLAQFAFLDKRARVARLSVFLSHTRHREPRKSREPKPHSRLPGTCLQCGAVGDHSYHGLLAAKRRSTRDFPSRNARSGSGF